VSNQLATILFSPRRYLTSQAAVREYLSASLNRQELINSLIGEQTFMVAPAASNLIGQSQTGYSGSSGLSPVTQMTLPDNSGLPFTGSSDCKSCASAMLNNGFGLKESGGVTRFSGISLSLRLAVGPTEVMQRLGRLVQRQWKLAGVSVYIAPYPSEIAAANSVAFGAADAALVNQTLGPIATSATSWYGPRRSDQIDAGWRTTLGNEAALSALSTFNPVDGLNSWRALDAQISSEFWARPLFSLPYYLRWSSSISSVLPASSLDGLICQVTLWNAT
jgi:hypothetical protein